MIQILLTTKKSGLGYIVPCDNQVLKELLERFQDFPIDSIELFVQMEQLSEDEIDLPMTLLKSQTHADCNKQIHVCYT